MLKRRNEAANFRRGGRWRLTNQLNRYKLYESIFMIAVQARFMRYVALSLVLLGGFCGTIVSSAVAFGLWSF